jgi:hypothetical protein
LANSFHRQRSGVLLDRSLLGGSNIKGASDQKEIAAEVVRVGRAVALAQSRLADSVAPNRAPSDGYDDRYCDEEWYNELKTTT